MIKKISFVLVFTICGSLAISLFMSQKESEAATDTINLTANVIEALTLGLSSSSISFGDLIPGSPVKGSSGININVQTSATNGYTLALSDGVVSNGSALLHTDTTTRIADYSASIASPTAWNSGTDVGLGFTMYAAETNKEISWGAGSAFDHPSNRYAGIPQNATLFHTSSGYKASADTSSISFILDVPVSQKVGNYSGVITVTAIPVLE